MAERTALPFAVAACGLLAFAAVAQTTVYRWVDEQGGVHYAETVPERYRSGARAITVPASPPPREPPSPGGAAKPAPPAPTRAPAAAVLPRPTGKRPARVPDASTDCQTWQRLYLESADCFGPYRTARGGIKPEAFERCNEVPEPPIDRCRLRLP